MRAQGFFRLLRLGVALGVLGFVLPWAWRHETREPVRFASDAPQTLVIEVGESAAAIGRKLQTLGLVPDAAVFRALVFARGDGARLRAGEYSLHGTLSLDDIVDKLVRGEVARHDVTFPEGLAIDEIAALVAQSGLEAAAFLRAARDPAPIRDLDPLAADLEGYLFPDTYDFTGRADAPVRLVARMLGRFREVISPELPRLPAAGLTLRQLVTLASLVELETARAEERPRIAAVFLNRLAKKMLLQTDPTVIYALRLTGGFDGNIRKQDLSLDSPYNTYKYPGLPPGPIASPGLEALLAVLQPADTKDLYFVSRNDGSHEFSATLAEHERAVDRYQRRRRATAGS